jgi:hypothetical protein
MRTRLLSHLFFGCQVLGLALLLAFSAVAGASAGNGPIRTVYTTDFHDLSPILTAECGFPVTRDASGTLAELVWLDAQGQPVRATYTFPTAKLELSANGHVMKANAAGPGFVTYSSDGSTTEVSTGTIHFTTAPGSGVVFGLAGRLVEVLNANGDVIDSDFHGTSGEIAKACAFLAP